MAKKRKKSVLISGYKMNKMSDAKITIVIPVHNATKTLQECLSAVYRSNHPIHEVIVVDDCSTDESVQIASRFPCKVVKLESNVGAATARNRGAEAATGDVICFVDSDVVLPENALSIVSESFNSSDVSGVVGLLSNRIRYKNLCSRYKNSYMHYTYMRLPADVAVFYTSIASIKKDVFKACGEFDENYRSASIEDLEFGQRVVSRGYRLCLNKSLQVEHIRHYSLRELLKTGIKRTAGIIKIRLRARTIDPGIRNAECGVRHLEHDKKRENYVTSPRSFMLGIALAYLSLISLAIGALTKTMPLLVLAPVLYLLILCLNFPFLNFLRKSYGWLFFAKSCLLIFADMLAHGLGGIVGVLSYARGRKY